MPTGDKHSTAAAQQRAIQLIRIAMIEKKISQAALADAADCHEKTVQNLLAGKSVRQQTLFDVCMVLGLDYERVRATWAGEKPGGVAVAAEGASSAERREAVEGGAGGDVAPIYMGAYTRAAVDHFIGSYLTLRPGFSDPAQIVAYRTDIAWDDAWPSLVFEESRRPDADYSHKGRIYVPSSSMYFHLVSLTKGAMRMVLLSQPDRTGVMRGIITTQHKSGALLVPVAAPIVYAKRESFSGVGLGDVDTTHADHAAYRALLGEVTDSGYARLIASVGA